jgi:Amt family ammonium transporter
MIILGRKMLAGLLLAGCIAGGPLAAPALAQDTATATTPATPEEAAAATSPIAAAAPSDQSATAPADAAPPAPAEAPAEEWAPDSGDTAWMLTSTVLVLMMTIPGLALFYGGMVRRKNVIATVTQSFAITALATVVWAVIGYSLAFTTNPDETLNKFIGGFEKTMLNGVGMTSANSLAGTIPEFVFITFQMTFAIITPALIAGAFAERMKFSAMLLFMLLWSIIVYAPIAHAVWGGGILGSLGALDFAGGLVVHINAGVAGLVCAIVLGRRQGFGRENMAPHNLVLTMIGASLLWVGWFGFNAGSAVASNALAGAAMINTQVATAAAALAWMGVEWAISKKPTLLGLTSGAVAGLVAITPAAGFVNPQGSLVIGVLAGVGCYFSAVWLKRTFKYDDSLDAFGVHGVGGIIGALLVGVLADPSINALGEGASVVKQLISVVATIAYTGVATLVILLVVKMITGLRVKADDEIEGLDYALHGETLHP